MTVISTDLLLGYQVIRNALHQLKRQKSENSLNNYTHPDALGASRSVETSIPLKSKQTAVTKGLRKVLCLGKVFTIFKTFQCNSAPVMQTVKRTQVMAIEKSRKRIRKANRYGEIGDLTWPV